MHRKRLLRYFRNSISAIVALSMVLGNVGTGVSTVFASEAVEEQQVVEEAIYETEDAVEETQVSEAEDNLRPTATPQPGGKWDITCEQDGQEFDTDTLQVQLELSTATVAPKYRKLVSCTYSVDNGPINQCTWNADANESVTVAPFEIGEGKIGNSEITVRVTAKWSGGNKVEKTFTFKKLYNPETDSKYNRVRYTNVPNESNEQVKEAAINAGTGAAESAGIYATNPNGQVGEKATISIDGDFSDWSESMLIAQSAACDTATRFKGCWENWVMDSYSLYGAWDDENLYVAWQNVNTYDTFWEQDGNGPLSDNGKPGDAPVMIAINTNKGNAMTGRLKDGNGIWGIDVEFDTRIDNLLVIHSDLTGTPGLFKADSTGATSYAKEDGLLSDFKSEGIEVKKVDGCLPSTIMGVWNPGDENCYASYDLSSNWVDLKTTDLGCRVHDTKYDTFYEMKIPFKALGITKEDVETNGVGVMQLISRGESGMDCVPHDPSMLDNTYESYGAEPSNSHEKDDKDIITVPLASIGKAQTIVTATPTPAVMPPTLSPTPVITLEPSVTVTNAPTPTGDPTPTPAVAEGVKVNFGAEVSAPQYNTTDVVLRADTTGGYGDVEKYIFYVDNEEVQNATDNTYLWKDKTVGTHNIKVEVWDEEGYATSERTFTVCKDGEVVEPTPVITEAIPTITTTVTATPTPAPTGYWFDIYNYSARTATKLVTVLPDTTQQSVLSVKAGEEVTLNCTVAETYQQEQVMYTYLDAQQQEVILRNYGKEKQVKVTFDEAGEYPLYVYAVNGIGMVKKLAGIVIHVENVLPTTDPDVTATVAPTQTVAPTVTADPTLAPTITTEPVVTLEPTVTAEPSITTEPTIPAMPTDVIRPSRKPTITTKPTVAPTIEPTIAPTTEPTTKPTITPNTKLAIKDFTTSVASGKAQVGDKITLKATAQGGKGTLKYRFTYSYNGKTKTIKNFSKSNQAVFKPKKAGKYSLTVKVKDSKGNVVGKTTKSYKVKEKFAVKDLDISYKSKKLKVKVSVQGSQGSVKYKYVLKRGGKTVKSTSYKKKSTFTARNLKKGTYKFTVYVKDGDKTVKKTVSFKVR